MTFDLSSLGWDDALGADYARYERLDARPARVARVDRGVCTVLTAQGAHRASIGGGLLSAAAKDPVALPCAGDWVVVRAWPDGRTTIEAVLPRRTAVVRASADKDSSGQVLAANIDTAVYIPVKRSVIATPAFCGPPPGRSSRSPVTLMKPLMPWMMKS